MKIYIVILKQNVAQISMKYLLLIFILSFSLYANNYNIKLTKVTPNIYCHIGKFDPPSKSNKSDVSNICYIDIGDSLVVIEPGPTYNFAKEFVKLIENKTNKKVSAVIASNYHDDRIYGASYYRSKGIDFIAHKKIISDIKSNPNKFNRLPKLLSKDTFKNTKLVYPNILVDDGYTIKGSKLNIKILKLSKVSDSPSDIVVYIPQEKFLFVGNIIFTNRMIRYHHDSNLDLWLEALNKISKMTLRYIVPGHGEDFSNTNYIQMIEYLNKLRKVKNLYENDVDRLDINIDFSKFKNRAHYNDLVNRNVSEYYNQLEWAE